jgi:drug/metabolite transporter (DMT)-like permease
LLHALGSWQPYALATLGILGMVLSQNAFYAGPLQASLPVLTITEPLVAGLIGVAAFHEHVATHGLRAAGGAVSVIVLALGIIGLSRSPLVLGAHPPAEDARPT